MSQNYCDYTLKLTFRSSIGTPLQSDTLFGHICWAVRYLDWASEDKLGDFLGRFDEDKPPLLISNGFPEGYLPKPILPPVTQDILDEYFGLKDRIENSHKIKTIKAASLIPIDGFERLQRVPISPRILFVTMKDCWDYIECLQQMTDLAVVQHNTIDRVTGRVRIGGLFSQEETFHDEGAGKYTVYLKTDYFTRHDLERIFRFIQVEGYGRDKSTGKGHFTFEIMEGIDVPLADKPNAFMTLSSFIPKEKDPAKGYYSLVHKYGKLGGLYASGGPEVHRNPFKVPLIMFAAGSVFLDDGYGPAKVYGSLLGDVHHNRAIRHYAYAFPVGIQIEVHHEEI